MEVGRENRLLERVRILDFTRVLSGPFCTRILADLGAEIIKVESESGDSVRHHPPFREGFASYFAQFNVGKKSIGVNLRSSRGIEVLKKLVPGCDAVVENFRPGVMEKMGLGYPALAAVNPRLIFCSISGFGQTGPERTRLAYTDIIQAYSGLDYSAGQMIGPGVDPPGFPISFGDSYASLNAAVAILAALYSREFTGKGQAIDISMLDCLFAANDSTIQKFIFSGGQLDHPGVAFRPPLKMKDGQVAAALFMNFEGVIRAMNRPDLLEDPRFRTMEERVKLENFQEYFRAVQQWAKGKTVEEASEIFAKYDIPYGKVNTVAEIVASPVVKERNMLVEVELKKDAAVKVVNTPFKFSTAPSGPRSRPPHLGEHNEEIFRDLLGLSREEILNLRKEGVLFERKPQEPG
jgi:formyl-CoA transferase/CoA:oxalate CoA-transferase